MNNKVMERYKFFLKAFIAEALVLYTACGPDDDNTCCDPSNPECPNYDACYGVEEPTAKILMREQYIRPGEGYFWTPYDSVFYNEVQFSSPYIGPEFQHTWYLGAEVIHDPVFTRSHPIDRPQFITVSHVITFPVDSTCYVNQTGRDSTSATYYIIEYWNEFEIFNQFRIAFENQVDSFDMKTTRINEDGTPAGIPTMTGNNPKTVAINFHNEGDSIVIPMGGRDLEMYLAGNGNTSPKGLLKIDTINRKHVIIEYQYHNQPFKLLGRILD